MKIEIIQDISCSNPLEDIDFTSKFIFFGKHSNIGHDHNIMLPRQYNSRFDFMEQGCIDVKKNFKWVLLIRPIHYYEHSGSSISYKYQYPYNDRWDSGTIGFQIVTRADWKSYHGGKQTHENILNCMNGEVELLDQWLQGDVYGFRITDDKGDEVDSCWGFYGSDPKTNGMYDHWSKETIDAYEKQLTALE